MSEETPEAKFLVSDWGDKADNGIGFRTGLKGYIGWRAGTTTLCHSRLYPPSQRLRIWLQLVTTKRTEEARRRERFKTFST
jgi:hypothetical protein